MLLARRTAAAVASSGFRRGGRWRRRQRKNVFHFRGRVVGRLADRRRGGRRGKGRRDRRRGSGRSGSGRKQSRYFKFLLHESDEILSEGRRAEQTQKSRVRDYASYSIKLVAFVLFARSVFGREGRRVYFETEIAVLRFEPRSFVHFSVVPHKVPVRYGQRELGDLGSAGRIDVTVFGQVVEVREGAAIL